MARSRCAWWLCLLLSGPAWCQTPGAGLPVDVVLPSRKVELQRVRLSGPLSVDRNWRWSVDTAAGARSVSIPAGLRVAHGLGPGIPVIVEGTCLDGVTTVDRVLEPIRHAELCARVARHEERPALILDGRRVLPWGQLSALLLDEQLIGSEVSFEGLTFPSRPELVVVLSIKARLREWRLVQEDRELGWIPSFYRAGTVLRITDHDHQDGKPSASVTPWVPDLWGRQNSLPLGQLDLRRPRSDAVGIGKRVEGR